MSTTDHGLEAIRKAAVAIDANENHLRVNDYLSQAVLEDILDALLGTTGVTTNIYNAVASVPASSLTTIVSYTVPVASTFTLSRLECGGQNIASYQVEIDNVVVAKKRTYYASDFFVEFDFKGYDLTAGQVIRVRVLHTSPMSGDFEGRILGDLA